MPRGPLPDPNSRRRNAPTIPSTAIPAEGRKGRAPAVPANYRLRKAGKAWWAAAWKTPQSANWDAGAMFTAARRATLEDDLAILDHFDPFELADLLGMDENERIRELGFIIGRLKGLAGGRVSVMKEMRELDRQLGLGPKALADLRWVITEGEEGDEQPTPAKAGRGRKRATTPSPTDRRARLTAIPGGRAATG